MREISCCAVADTVANMCIESCCILPDDVRNAVKDAYEAETSTVCKAALMNIIDNYTIAERENVPICQDTGICCVFLTVGQEVHITGGSLYEAVNKGVRRGYETGYLRKSVVFDPITRINTKDNTPALVYYDIVPGDSFAITIVPKGAGSENMSRIAMLTPSDGLDGVCDFIVDCVVRADANPCPPVIVGVGIGGDFERAAINSKKALIRNISKGSDDPYYADLEDTLRKRINETGIGTMGYGGTQTCLKVNIIAEPTHIAMLPVAVNMSCHCTRHVTRSL